jgi:hypothetical protein
VQPLRVNPPLLVGLELPAGRRDASPPGKNIANLFIQHLYKA